ncbi:DUF7268 family protein [Halosegnis longus]|uniref:Uncharacterized protein n=1 Tax=Halosegnis longus TaxID=2216012 RepID=A0AAJ4UWF9_9EURY|nr:hypothetical protein Nmn1133_10605 [Salella cibi]
MAGTFSRAAFRRRLRLFLPAAGLGIAVGLSLVAVLATLIQGAVGTVFAIGSLAFGIGLLGWSGAVGLGRSLDSMKQHLGADTAWTQANARRAMTRLLGFGVGIMLAASLTEPLVAAL